MDSPPNYDHLYEAPNGTGAAHAFPAWQSPINESEYAVMAEDPMHPDNARTVSQPRRRRNERNERNSNRICGSMNVFNSPFHTMHAAGTIIAQFGTRMSHAFAHVCRPYTMAVYRFDTFVGRYVNPQLLHRIIFLALVFLGLVALSSVSGDQPGSLFFGGEGGSSAHYMPPGFIGEYIRTHIDAGHIERSARYLDSVPHIVGSRGGVVTADHVQSTLMAYGVTSSMVMPMPMYMTRPKSVKLTLFNPDGSERYSTGLDEGDARVGRDSYVRQPPAHMALSQGGTARGHLVYVNYGSVSDLEALEAAHVDIHGAVVLVRYNADENTGTVVKRLENSGAAGAVFFSKKTAGYETWPVGPDYPEDAVQRSSVALPELYPGDVLSPGWPSLAAMSIEDFSAVRNLAKIPTVAASWQDIGPLLASLKDRGLRVDDWHNNGYPRVVEEWYTGSSNEDERVEAQLEVQVDTDRRRNARNVLGRMEARDDQSHGIMLGARLDSHCAGGASLSGLSVMLEVARVLSLLAYEQDWAPLRSIYFMAWDGSSANYAGSTEWAESREEQLFRDGLLYIDLDEIVGDQLRIEGSPTVLLDDILRRVQYNETHLLYDLARANTDIQFTGEGAISSLPYWREFNNAEVFASHVQTPTIRLGMANRGPYPRDSCYDSSKWMDRFGDGSYQGHRAIGELAARLVVQYANQPIVQFGLLQHASQLRAAAEASKALLREQFSSTQFHRFDLQSLDDAINHWTEIAAKLDARVSVWQQQFLNEFEMLSSHSREPQVSRASRMSINDRLLALQKAMYARAGLIGRSWYRNLLSGISGNGGTSEADRHGFLALRDAANSQDLTATVKALQVLTYGINILAQDALAIVSW